MRRAIDILTSGVALVVLSPFLLAVAVAIVLDSRGNPFYLAWRCGLRGRRFRMWKFRTMVPDAESVGPAITGYRDARITRLGRMLRLTKIDELPQFINVLVGDMTLVGPRPETPGIVALYTVEQRLVLNVKPGVTGRCQLAGEESESIPNGVEPQQYYVMNVLQHKLQSDLDYLETRTAWSDARIVRDTVGLMLRPLFKSK